ncbi:MAG: DUF2752 domain-containing protein [Flavobacterium sp.]|nr:DUF2752 domain-containing protein [Flavobacterium sp.]
MDLEKYMIPCVNKQMFGIECLGCGTQRALLLITKGEFLEAFKIFPPIYSTILLFLVIALLIFDKKRNYHKIVIFLAVINAIIMIISYFYKIFNCASN